MVRNLLNINKSDKRTTHSRWSLVLLNAVYKCSSSYKQLINAVQMYRSALYTGESLMLQEFKKKNCKAKHVATRTLQIACTLGKVLPTQETETIQAVKSLLFKKSQNHLDLKHKTFIKNIILKILLSSAKL